MSSTSGSPYYSSRTMNGINQISVINENITDLENKTQDITYNDLTQTTTIINNTELYDVTINGTLTGLGGAQFLTTASNATITGNWGFNNIKLLTNHVDLSNNGSMSFVDDGLSAVVVDSVHNQTIAGAKTFSGVVDTDSLVCNSLTFPDGSTQTSANYLTPIRVDATDRVTATNSMTTDQLTATDIYCDTINISDKIIDANNTGTAPKSFIYNATTMCHKDVIVNNTPLVVAVGHRVKPNGIGLQPSGDAGLQIATIDTTNRNMTFNPAGNFSLTNPPATKTYAYCAITGTNTFTSYETLAGLTNFGIRGSSTSANRPFVNSLTGLYNATTPTGSLTFTFTNTKRGYISANNRLVSLDTYTSQPFIDTTGISHPTYIDSTFGTNDYTILSRNTITPNTVTATFFAIPISTTQLAYANWTGANNDFITQLNNITGGTKSTNNATTGILTLTLSHTPPALTPITYSGYVSGSTLKLEANPLIALNQYVIGTGTGLNGIPANGNSFVLIQPTAPSSTYTLRSGQGGGSLTPTNTTSTAGIIGYVRSASSKFWFISNTQQTNNDFIEGTGIPQATRMLTPTSPFVGQSKIMQLTQINNYTITATSPPITAFGYVSSTTEVRITSNPALTSSFIFENASSFNSLIPNGTQISSYNGTNQAITTTGLTASTQSGSFFGYMETTTSIQLRGLGTSTQRQNTFFTGTGSPSTRNYISVAATSTPLTFANAGTASVGTTIPGYTKNASGTQITLITSTANKTPFNSATFFIIGGSLATGITRSAVSQGVSSTSSTDIVITSDGESFTTSNNTTQEPTSPSVYYTAYALTSTKFYVLQAITTLTGSTNYIEALGLDNEFSFTRGLSTLGTFSGNGYDTTNLISSPSRQSLNSAIYNAGSGNYYYCDKNTDNSVDRFLTQATLAPASSVVYNSTTFEKGSNSLSKLSYKTAPTASNFVTNCNGTISYFIRSTAVVTGKQQTILYFKTNTRASLININQFFINGGGFANSGLNGGHIIDDTLNSTGLAGQFKLQHNTAVTPTAYSFTDNAPFPISTTQFDMFFLTAYVPAVGHFFQSDDNVEPNYIIAVLPITSPFTGNYRITIAYPILYKPADNYYFYIPINTDSSLLSSSIVEGYEASRFKVFQSGQTFTYYPRISYNAFSPITINFYNGTNTRLLPIQYQVQAPFTYSNITPLTINEYPRTTISFHATETITFFTFFDIALPPNSTNTQLVSIDAIQTLTNKTLTSPTINTPTITTPTISSATINTSTTINTSLTLFGNAFRYVPWTQIASRTGSTGSALSNAITTSAGAVPTASTATDCRLRYFYSVIGKTMCLNFLYFASTGSSAAGGGYYKYRLPAGFTYNSLLISANTSAASFQSGTRLGQAIIHINASAISPSSVYWLENPTGQYFMVIVRELNGTYNYHSNTNVPYTTANICISFNVEIPLA